MSNFILYRRYASEVEGTDPSMNPIYLLMRCTDVKY